MKNSIAIYITIGFVLALVAGCTSMRTPFADVETNPVHATFDSNAPYERCITRRDTVRTTKAEEVRRLLRGETTVSQRYRTSAQQICAQDDLREADGQLRALTASHEACASLLGPDGISAEATGLVNVETTPDPELLTALREYRALLMTDDEAYCSGRAMGGGMNGMAINGQIGGIAQVGGFGGVGIMPGVFGLGNATRNIVFSTQGMNPSVTATVSIAGLTSGLQLTYRNGETPVTVADGVDYQVSVICSVNGFETSSHSRAATPSNSRVMVNVLCGRHRRLNRNRN